MRAETVKSLFDQQHCPHKILLRCCTLLCSCMYCHPPTLLQRCCCLSSEHWNEIPCNDTAGFLNCSIFFDWGKDGCSAGESASDCYITNSNNKLYGDSRYSGSWYSTLARGCATPTNPTPNCTWRVVSVDAIIERSCQNSRFMDAVAEYNRTCFNACTNPTCVCSTLQARDVIAGACAQWRSERKRSQRLVEEFFCATRDKNPETE